MQFLLSLKDKKWLSGALYLGKVYQSAFFMSGNKMVSLA